MKSTFTINNKALLLFIFTASFFCSNQVNAQNQKITFDRLAREQGLIPGNVNDIIQDSIGFIWMATENGLCRFDGYNFLYFKNELNDSNSLSFNHVFTLLEDSNGIIWVGTLGGGLNKFNTKTGIFKRYQHDIKNQSSLSSDIVYKLFRDSKNRIWISTLGGGLNLFDPKNETFINYRHIAGDTNSISSNMASAVYEDKNNNLWIGTFDGGINLFNEDENKFIHFKHDAADIFSLSHNQVMQFLEDDYGRFWIATFGGGVNLFDRKKNIFHNINNDKNFPVKPDHLNVRQLLEDENYIWVGTYSGLFRFDKVNFQKTDIYYSPNDPKSINNNKIRSVFKDRTGVLWVGTIAGVNKHDTMKKKFQQISFTDNYKSINHNVKTLPSKYITEKIFWASGVKSKYYYNGNRKIRFFSDDDFSERSPGTFYSSSYIDEDGVLWVGSYNGIHFYDPVINEFVNVQYADDGTPALGNNFVKWFYIDKSNHFWAGTMAGGLSYFNPQKNELKKYIHFEEDKESISDSRVMTIFEDSKNILWVGTYGGLDVFNENDETFKHYRVIPNDSTCISNDRIYNIYESKAGELWIGTYQGLNRYNRAEDNFEQFTTQQGMADNTVYSIQEDEIGNLWIRTNDGISKFDPVRKIFNNYNVKDGLPGMELNGNIYFKNKDGKMFFGFSNGLISFYPDEIIDNPYKPEVVFTKLVIMDQEIKIGENSPLEKPLNELDEVVFSYKDKIINFEFAALHFAIPSKNKYAYKLEGFLDDWVFVDANQRSAKFTNLNPGKYVLKVMASNNDGIWSQTERSITIIITPPFWETWWFRGIAILSFLFIIFLFYEMRLQRLVEIERTRTRIARNLHDEVGGSLSSIQYFVRAIEKELLGNSLNGSSKYLKLIMESSADAQEKIKDLIWTVNPEEDGLGKFLIKFNRYASDLLDSKEINYNINLPSGIVSKSIPMEKRQHLWCICKETLTNIVRHSQCKNVDIKVIFNGSKLDFYISDDGVGFDSAQKSFSNGIVNIKNRSELLKADYSLKTSLNNGTEWYFSIKI
ncbi:MAG: hypothetical protein KJ571_14100 [Bacteroidetes bacterium]|nr:hypothetical protein [Bacteroidota bacterium]